MDIRIGNGYDVHALAPDLPMWLGGIQIPSSTGFVAHSDGDVILHALCDAILGPPSTFSQWASFMGRVPRLQIKSRDQVVRDEDFAVADL